MSCHDSNIYPIETKQNKPFEVVDNGVKRIIWDSRSSAVAGIIFVKNKKNNWFVLANKRGQGCPDFKGYWCCPCGYLDWDEDAYRAIWRETWEETGLTVASDRFNQIYTNTDPQKTNLQNVTIIHYAKLPGTIDNWSNFDTSHMEPNEVEDIRWIPVEQVNRYNWAFDHNNTIIKIYNTYINIPWYKKLVLKYYNKWFKY